MSVTLYMLLAHLVLSGLGFAGTVAPVGMVRKNTLWMLVVSLLMNSMVVPAATEMLAGLKLRLS